MSLRERERERERGRSERARTRERERERERATAAQQVRSHVASKLAEHGPAEHGPAEQGRPRPNMAPTADTANAELPRGPDGPAEHVHDLQAAAGCSVSNRAFAACAEDTAISNLGVLKGFVVKPCVLGRVVGDGVIC